MMRGTCKSKPDWNQMKCKSLSCYCNAVAGRGPWEYLLLAWMLHSCFCWRKPHDEYSHHFFRKLLMAARPTPASTQQMISRMDRCSTIWSRFCRIVSVFAIFFLHLDVFIAGVPLTRKSFAGRPDCDHKSNGCRCWKERELCWQVSRSLLSLVSCLLSLLLAGRSLSLSER